jgi:UDP-glucose 4-epimerase
LKILITGGAGYIGSHLVKALLDKGFDVITFDNLSTGYKDAILGGEFFFGDLNNQDDLVSCFTLHKIDLVMHLAAHISVSESVLNPSKYYFNNVFGTLNLLNVMIKYQVHKIIFSSTAAIYGEPLYTPIDENHQKLPINPYGKSKFFIEQILEDYRIAFGLNYVGLRYFNAAGASLDGSLGENHNPETHIIPLAVKAALGKINHLTLFGRDYMTPDGTCIRDFVHVLDICNAHILAMIGLLENKQSSFYNIGNGNGYSLNEVINTTNEITDKEIKIIYGDRRVGDPPVLIADATKIKNELNWMPEFSNLKTIISHALSWELKSKFH